MPTVSVIIPTYNRPNLLRRSLASVLLQTYGDLEVIIVDEGSSEETHLSNAKTARSDNRVRYVYKRENRGIAAARNDGIRMASGRYVAFLDDDDMWLPQKLQKQIRFISSVRNLEVVCCDSGTIDIGGKLLSYPGSIRTRLKWNIRRGLFRRCSVRQRWYRVDPCALYRAALLTFVFFLSSTALVERKCLVNVGLFDENLPTCEDWELVVRLARSCSFGYLDEILAYARDGDFRHHQNRLSTNAELLQIGHIRALDKVERDMPDTFKPFLHAHSCERYLPFIHQLVIRGDFDAADALLNRMAKSSGPAAIHDLLVKLCVKLIISDLDAGDFPATEPLIYLLARERQNKELFRLITRITVSSPLTALRSLVQPATNKRRQCAVRCALRLSMKIALRPRRFSGISAN